MNNPNQHFHIPVLNLTKNKEGKWVTFELKMPASVNKIYQDSLSASLGKLSNNLGHQDDF